MDTINKTDMSLLYFLTQHNTVSGTGDSSDTAKNIASELMAHVDQMTTGGQDRAAQQTKNVDSDGGNIMTVSIYWFVKECIA